jgi:2-phosphosulfolactate phosphatase
MIHSIDVFSSSISFSEQDVRDKTVVVIDVLRSCSTIQTALERGASSIIPLGDNDDAGRYTRYLDAASVLLCGEKDGKKVEGYQLGNSPMEFTEDVIRGKTILFKTTNGTKAITRSTGARKLLVGSFLNLSAVADELRQEAASGVVLICSGWHSRLSIEDMLCAGAIIHKVFDNNMPGEATDGVKMAYGLFEKFGHDIPALISECNHAKRLRDLGYGDDVSYCSQVDLFGGVPRMHEGVISNR